MNRPVAMTSRAARNEAYLAPLDAHENLRRRSVRGGLAMVVAQGTTFAISVGGTAVLARILTPRDFGLIAMVATFTRLAEQFKDLGLAMATVQRREISHAQVSSLFWINFGAGVAAAGLTMLAAPLLVWFYGEPNLDSITLALGTAFCISGVGVQHQALLQRRLQFKSIATVRISAALLGTAAGIIAAVANAGYWALVTQQLVSAAAHSSMTWLACPWRPSWPGRDAVDVKSLVAFGGRITASRLLGFVTRNLDNILIGRVWGDVALGLYAKAYQLLMLPVHQLINPLTSVVVPALSRLQHNQAAYIAYYQRALRTLSTLSMPLVVLSFVAAPEVIGVALGERWAGAVPIFQFLAPAAFAGSLNPTAWAWISLNQTDRLLRWGLIATPIYVVAFAVGVAYGPEGVAIAFSAVTTVLRYFSAAYCFRGNFLSMRILVAAIWQPTAASLGAGALAWVAAALLPPLALVPSLAVKSALYAGAYLGLWWLLPGGPAALRETLSLARELRGTTGG